MSPSSTLFYIVALSVVLAVCGLAQWLLRNFRLYFLSPYLAYVVTISIVFFIDFVVSDISQEAWRSIPLPSQPAIYALFGLALFPLFAIAYYYFFIFIFGVLDVSPSRLVRAAYIFLWMALLAAFLVRIQTVFQRRPSAFSRLAEQGVAFVVLLIPVVLLAYLIVGAFGRSRRAERGGLLRLALVSLAGYFVLVGSMLFSQTVPSFRWVGPVLFGLGILGPVLALRDLLSRFYRPIPPEALDGPRMRAFCEQHRLSKRETELLGLLLKGKSNADIEKDLFISPHTVRNHVHNIYQKLGIKNRVQLANRVWEDAPASPPESR